jgi:hypothetical protein
MTAVTTVHGARRARASADRETVALAVPAKNPHRRGGDAAFEPLRSSAAELVELLERPEASTPHWHEQRAAALGREARVHPVAAVSNAYQRLAARHVATAEHLVAGCVEGGSMR